MVPYRPRKAHERDEIVIWYTHKDSNGYQGNACQTLLVKTLKTFVKIVRYLISYWSHRSWLTSCWLSGFGVSLWLPYLSSSCNLLVICSLLVSLVSCAACHFVNFRTLWYMLVILILYFTNQLFHAFQWYR